VDAAGRSPTSPPAPAAAALGHADLTSMREARDLVARAQAAQKQIAELSQAQIDAIVDAMAAAVTPQCEALAQLAHEETGFGVAADKVRKNRFAAETVYQFIKPMKTVGVLRRIEATKVIEIAEPFGVVAAIIPTTNPTSTAIYKILIAIKARCAIVMSPHPSAIRCITRVAEIMEPAARAAGLPEGGISCLKTVTLEGTQELMRQKGVRVILATGGMGLVRAAYSAGKPAYGVGPGNAPAYIEKTADVAKAVADILTGKTFDNGLLCSSENSVVVDEPIAAEVKAQFLAQGGYFLNAAETEALAKVLVMPQRLPNPQLVGRPATVVAAKAGISVPPGTRALIAPLDGVGRDYPLSIEKLCPVLSFYVVKDWQEGCLRCQQILQYGGMGHTMSIHSRNDDVILQFGLKKPAFRIVVNTPTTLGSIGLTTGLDPAMTLGCGGWGGNITSDNISPLHLINVKRLAYEVRSARPETAQGVGAPAPGRAPLSSRVEAFLGSRGFRPAEPTAAAPAASETSSAAPADLPSSRPEPPAPPPPPVPFVCEDDVRAAARAGRRIVLGPKTIVTPAARDAGEALRLFDMHG
jgi:acetaldehyde dehydrogenase (acetylating)